MKPSTYVLALFHGYYFQNEGTIRIEAITEETNYLYGTNMKTQFSHIIWAPIITAEVRNLQLCPV
jgi:hypothetical protein